MSETVDTRVVRMEFDNRQFEKNVKKTSQSLENLKQNLDFKGVGNSIDEVRLKISALEIAATTFIVRISNKLINLGATLVKSLSVDNISSGWSKFGEKTVSVATMMAQKIRVAGQEITDLALKTEVVNQQLEMLTWFADETSYSFTDMVNSVGKFTAAGQDLDVSVKAMEGIATWAAKSGQNAATASRAMYQLAQAMGKGKIQKIDWMSIQNANMDTEEFRETILATAVAMGELTKEGDKFVTKTGKKFTQAQFADFLSEGWFTSDVLVQGLNKYSAAVEKIYEISSKTGKTASEVMEEYADELDEFGLAAFKAAQEARTFADVINSVKDAVSSKWMTTFENIFGGKEEAVSLWTELANELYDVFAESGNFRNEILSVWKEMGGRDDLFARGGDKQGAFWNIYDAIIALRDLIKSAWNTVFPITAMEDYNDQVTDIGNKFKSLTTRIREFTSSMKMSNETTERLSKLFKAIFTILKLGLVTLKTIRFIIDPIIEAGKQLISQVLDKINYSLNKLLKTGNNVESFAVKLQKAIASLIDSLSISDVLDEVFFIIQDIAKTISDLHPIQTIIRWIESFVESMEKAGGTVENFKKIIKSVLSIISLVRKFIFSIVSAIVTYVVPILDDIIDIISKLVGFLVGTAIKIISVIAEVITTISEALQGNGNADDFKKEIFGILESLGQLAKSLVPIINSLVKILFKLVDVVLLIPRLLNEISIRLTGKGLLDNLVSLFDEIIEAITDFVKGINKTSKPGSIGGLFNALLNVLEGLWEVLKGLISAATAILTVLGSALKKIGQVLQYLSNILIKVFSGKAKELTTGEKVMLGVIAALAAQAIILVTVYNMFWLIMSIIKPLSVIADSLSGAIDSLALQLKGATIQLLADALLHVAIGIALLGAMDANKMWRGLAAMTIISGILAGLFVLVWNLNKKISSQSVESVKTFKEKLKSVISGDDGFASVAKLITALGKLFLKVAIAMLIFNKVSWSAWGKGISTIVILVGMITGLYAVVSILDKKSNKVSKGLKKAIQSEQDMFEEMKKFLKTTLAFVVVIKIFSKTVAYLGKLDTNVLIQGMISLSILMALIVAAFAAIQASLKIAPNTKNSDKVIKQMAGLVLSSVALAFALRILAKSDPKGLFIAVGALASVYAALGAVVIAITKLGKAGPNNANVIKQMANLVLASVALTVSLRILAKADPLSLLAGVGALSLLYAALGGVVITVTRYSKADKGLDAIIKSMSSLVTASVGLALALRILAKADPVKMIAAAGSLSLLITALGATLITITRYSKVDDNLDKIMGCFTKMLVATAVLTAVLKLLASENPVNLIAAAGSLAILILSLGAVVVAISKFTKPGTIKSIVAFSLSLIPLAGAMFILAKVIETLASLNAGSLWSGVGAILALITGLAAIAVVVAYTRSEMSLMTLAVGIAALNIALIPFIATVISLGEISFEQIGRGLLVVAAAIGSLALIAAVLSPVVGAMVALSAAMLLMGAGLLVAGLGMQVISTGFEALLQTFTANFEGIKEIVVQLGSIIIESLLNAVITLFDKLNELLPSLFEFIGNFLDGIIELLFVKGPAIIEVVMTVIDNLLRSLADHSESIFDSVFKILISLLTKLEENVYDIADKLFKILLKVLDKLIEYTPAIVEKIITALIALTKALFENIGPLIDVILDYTFDFVAKLIVAVTRKVVALAGLVAKVILILLAAALRIVIASLGSIGKLLIVLVSSILLMLTYIISGLADTLFEVFKVIIKEALKALVEAIIWAQDMFLAIGKLAVSLILRGVINTILAAGEWLLELIDTVFGTNITGKVKGIADGLANEARNLVNGLQASTSRVKSSISKAAANINEVVTMTADSANEAVMSGVNSIGSAVTDATAQLGDSLSEFGENAGKNILEGLNIGTEGADSIGNDIANDVQSGFEDTAEINSPSRVFTRLGQYLIEGLGLGIQNGSDEMYNIMSETLNESLSLANDIIDDQAENDLTLKVGLDISSVESSASRIQDIMSSVNNPSLSAAGMNADYNSRSVNKGKSSANRNAPVTNNNSSDYTYNNVFNISSTDPKESAEEIDKILQQQAMRRKMAHGM